MSQIRDPAGRADYRRLEATPDASYVEIVNAYRRLFLSDHPAAHLSDPAAMILGGPRADAMGDVPCRAGQVHVGAPSGTEECVEGTARFADPLVEVLDPWWRC